MELAERLLEEDPEIVSQSINGAVMVGDVAAVRAFLDHDSGLASRPGGPRDGEPLLYLCFSRFLRLDPERASSMVEVARLLLEHGADPNAYWTDPKEGEGSRKTPIYGAAGVANNRALTQVLLDAGADPNDGETPYHAAEHDGVPCVDLLWDYFDEYSRNIVIQHKVDYPDADGLRRLLELGADANAQRFTKRTPLHGCVFRGHERKHFEVLFEFGADPDIRDATGRTPYAMAARAGQQEIMDILVEHGASTDLDPTDAFLAACAMGDTRTVAKMLAATPEMVERLRADDKAVICEAAANGNAAGVRTMLDAGFDVDTKGRIWQEGPVHRAAMDGHLETVKLLCERGADLDMRDACYDAAPLGWAEHGGHADVIEYLRDEMLRRENGP